MLGCVVLIVFVHWRLQLSSKQHAFWKDSQESKLPVLASSALGLIIGSREQRRPCFMDISVIKSEPAFVRSPGH